MSSPSSLPKTIPAWTKRRGTFTPNLSQIPTPQCPPTGFLIRILAAGICHSDVGLLARDSPNPYYLDEYVLGHEGAGEIVLKGPEVPEPFAKEFEVGDVVAILSMAGCGKCGDCEGGLPQHCMNATNHGLGRDGSFTSYVAVDGRALVKVPAGVRVEEAAISTDAVMTSYHAVVRRGEAKKGEMVFVFGLGGLGCNAVQVLLHLGCRVFVADNRAEPLKHAVKLGVAREDVVPVEENVREWVAARGLQIDLVLDFAGVEQTVNDAIAIVKTGGRIVPVGLLQREIKINHILCITKRISLLYTFAGLKEDIQEGMDLIAKGVITPRIDRAPMNTFPEALKRLHEGRVNGRVVLIPEGVDQNA